MSQVQGHPVIAFIRATNLLTDDLVRSYMASQQLQLDRDLWPTWGLRADCIFVPPGQPIPPDAWQCVFLEDSDQAGALGYHETTAAGLPVMRVFMADVLRAQVRWTVTASHEVIETLGDPAINRTILVEDPTGGVVEYAWELCDCCEDDQFAYKVAGHWVSDFALPSWFSGAGAEPYTFRHAVGAPFALAEGGYIGVRAVRPVAGPWSQRLAQAGPRQAKAATSRTLRRFAAPEPGLIGGDG